VVENLIGDSGWIALIEMPDVKEMLPPIGPDSEILHHILDERIGIPNLLHLGKDDILVVGTHLICVIIILITIT